jgi:hypothetical protein
MPSSERPETRRVSPSTPGNPLSTKEATVPDPYDPLDPEEADYAEEDLERQISEMTAPAVPNDRLTAEELREPRSLDQELWRDRGEERKPDVHPVLVDHDVPDVEDELVAEASEDDSDLAPEELAMRRTIEAPGATDDADDGYGDDGWAAPRDAPD